MGASQSKALLRGGTGWCQEGASPSSSLRKKKIGKELVFINKQGSFGLKANGSAFYQIRQTGEDNLDIIKAACLIITGREARPIKADSQNSYQLTVSSKLDIQKVIYFLSSPNNHSLVGYKSSQYTLWLTALKNQQPLFLDKATFIEINSSE